MTNSNNRLQPLYDCLLTIIANISPYLKSLSMITSNKLLHLLEAFSLPTFLYSDSNNHHLVFFILEVFNNIIQYQFDGNSNLIYTIIRKRNVIYNLLNLPIDQETIDKIITNKKNKNDSSSQQEAIATSGTCAASLAATPSMFKMTENTTPTLNLDQSLTNQIFSDDHRNINNKENLTEETKTFSQLSLNSNSSNKTKRKSNLNSSRLSSTSKLQDWKATSEWVVAWKQKLPMQTIIRLLQVLVPQVEKICIDKGLTDESEIIRFLKNGTLVGLLPVPHPILIRKYQSNMGTTNWFKTYIWGVVYLRNTEPPIWYDTDVKLFEIQRI